MNPFLALATASVFAAAIFFAVKTRTPEELPPGCFDFDDEDVERLPDRIRLLRLDLSVSFVPERMTKMAEQLLQEGFEDAGTFAIDRLPDAKVRLLAHRGQSMQCAIWSHARSGSWFEFTCSYPGGKRTTFTTLNGTGFDGGPGHTVVRSSNEMDILDLYVRACTERPMGVFMTLTAETLANDFENRYSIWIAWRRAQMPAQKLSGARAS